jgi:hypothetical protein
MRKVLLFLITGVILLAILYLLIIDDVEISDSPNLRVEFSENKTLDQKIGEPVQPQNTIVPDFIKSAIPIAENSGIIQGDDIVISQTYETVIVPLIRDSLKAATDGNWEAFLKYSELMAQDERDMPTLQLVTAIKQNAPIYVIEELLKNGAEWNSAHANISVRMRNKKEIVEYINLGMDIYIDDVDLDNPINAMVRSIFGKSDEKRELFTFLLDSGVEIRKGRDGYHPVTKALLAAKKSEEAVFYIFQMMKREPHLTDEQIVLAKELKIDSPRSYSLLVRNVPEFAEVLNDQ